MPHQRQTDIVYDAPAQAEGHRPATALIRPLHQKLTHIPRFRGRRQVIQATWVLIDLAVLVSAAWLAGWLLDRPLNTADWGGLAVAGCIRILAFVRFGMYRAALRYSGVHVLAITVAGVLLGTAAGIAAGWFSGQQGILDLGRAFVALEALLAMAGCGGLRFAARLVLEPRWSDGHEPVLIYGAGDLGEATSRTLGRSGRYAPLGFLDDDPHKHGSTIHGRRVLGGLADLPAILERLRPRRVFVTISNLPDDSARNIVRACQGCHVAVTLVRGADAAHGGLRLRDLQLEDLLPRPSRRLDPAPVRSMLAGKTALVTGAGGSIGTELCRQICANGATELVLVDHSEFNLYHVEGELRRRHPEVRVVPVLDNLQNAERLHGLLAAYRPETVFHAAAYKHVPMVEANPFLGVVNNVGGFRNLLDAADTVGTPRVVLISTDKAVRPTNVMGATKRVCELLLQNRPWRRTRCAAVRFGNVLGSSGSVVPLFLDQIERGGPVTVTHPDINRFFMLIPEAVALVLASGAMADHGEIFILDMGQPVRIADMARQLIFLSGHTEAEIPITFTGLRPGEKLYEELLLGESERGTPVEGITVARATHASWPQLDQQVEQLLSACVEGEHVALARHLKAIVPEWVPSDHFAGAFSGEIRVPTPPAGQMRMPLPSSSLAG
jgi:FlaA1/EpsC-like NDP-sugar epimerase